MELEELLDEYGIEVWKYGENVTVGWWNINCPFCEDTFNHLGIRLSDFRVSCWKCGGHGIIELVSELAELPYKEARTLSESLVVDEVNPSLPIREKASSAMKTSLPRESSIHFPKMHIEYLRGRGFKPRQLIRQYKLQAVHTIGKYKFRIIIPIYMNGRLVSFTSRDVTDQQTPKYKNASPSECEILAKRAIYNYDTLTPGADAFAVEGPADVWKLGNGAIGLLGLEYTIDQVKLLMKKEIRTLFILFDLGETAKARSFARLMAPLVKNVEILTLQKISDPGAMTFSEAENLKSFIGFRHA